MPSFQFVYGKIQRIVKNSISFLLSCPFLPKNRLIHELLIDNTLRFNFDGRKFIGEGWDYIQKEVQKCSNVLIGEDHFSNEIPSFVKAVFDTKKFDNFFIEVDPYSTQIIINSIKDNTEEQQNFYRDYKDLFSFYALKPEFGLLEYIVKSGTNILGADQVVAYADRLVFNDMKDKTEVDAASQIYSYIAKQSKLFFDKFLENPENPMYFMTTDFTDQLSKLDRLDLSIEERTIIQDIRKSISIYQSGGHSERIQLIKHNLMQNYSDWRNMHNLYKYGAMHMARGESFLVNYDIGNIVANVAESNYEKSYHIMIVGEAGMQGAPFRYFPPSEVNTEEPILRDLKPFFNITTSGADWYLFNLLPVREAVNNNRIKLKNNTLLRVIKGYDSLVIIPKLTPAQF